MRFDSESERLLEVETEKVGEAIVIHVAGHLNDYAADGLSAELDEILGSEERRIIFELGEVMFLGSTALGQIMRAYRAAKEAEGYVRIANPQPLIAELLRLTKLDKIMRVYPSLEEALQGA